MNLLIVNDEILTAETMKRDIDWLQYGISKVFTAYNANDARVLIEQQLIDVLLCDIEMPDENGISLCRWINENKKEIECIFLTCHANFDYAQEAISLGCRNYILMPAKYEDIGQEVKKVVEYIKMQREAWKYQEYGKQAISDKKGEIAERFGAKKLPDELVAETISYVAKNLGKETLSVNELADKFGMHPVYLNRVFKNEKGTSIGKYIIGERMQMAADLLKDGHFSASIVAEHVGYSSYPSFNLMFKKYFGCSPTQYQGEKE